MTKFVIVSSFFRADILTVPYVFLRYFMKGEFKIAWKKRRILFEENRWDLPRGFK